VTLRGPTPSRRDNCRGSEPSSTGTKRRFDGQNGSGQDGEVWRLVVTARLQGTELLRTQLRLGSGYKARDLLRGGVWEHVRHLPASHLRRVALMNYVADPHCGCERELHVCGRVTHVKALRGHHGQEVAGVVGVRWYGCEPCRQDGCREQTDSHLYHGRTIDPPERACAPLSPSRLPKVYGRPTTPWDCPTRNRTRKLARWRWSASGPTPEIGCVAPFGSGPRPDDTAEFGQSDLCFRRVC